jgi:myo-inositol-1-phosphate synthase
VYKPIKDLLPMVNPCDFVVSGWDISGENLYSACKRAKVLEPDLIKQLKEELQAIVPLPAALNGEYIAANQAERADNVLTGTN